MSNPFSYAGKSVVVTGAATGVGAALLDVLAELDVAKVTVVDIKAPSGPHDVFVEANLGTPEGVASVLAAVDGQVDTLFNNVGVADTQPPRTVFAVNTLALRALSEGLLDRIPEGGAIVNTASTAGGQWPERVEKINAVLDIADWDAALDWLDAELPTLNQMPYFFSKECVQVYTMRSSRPTIRRGCVPTRCVRRRFRHAGRSPTSAHDDDRQGHRLEHHRDQRSNSRRRREVATALAFLGSEASVYVTAC